MVIMSPLFSFSDRFLPRRTPLSTVPLAEPKSTSSQRPFLFGAKAACCLEIFDERMITSQLMSRPTVIFDLNLLRLVLTSGITRLAMLDL